MHKTLVALALILSTSFATLADLTLSSTTAVGSAATGWTITGAASDKIGSLIADFGGDFNGDGYRDYVVAGSSVNIYVILGSAAGRSAAYDLSTPPTSGFVKITLPSSGVPTAVATGDVNGDGIPDLALAVEGATPIVYVIYGQAATGGSTWTTKFTDTIAIAAAGDLLTGIKGFSITVNGGATSKLSLAIGDFGGDAKNDVIVGSTQAATDGQVCVVFGKASVAPTPTGTATTTARNAAVDCTSATNLDNTGPTYDGYLYQGQSTDQLGLAIAAGQDYDGDGNEDLFVSSANSANAYIIYGAANVIPSAATALKTLGAGSLTANSGFTLVTQPASGAVTTATWIGNWNGAGGQDLALGLPADASNKGRVYILFGQSSKPAGAITLSTTVATMPVTTGIAYSGAFDNGALGWSLDNAGDVNNDGTVDLIVSAPYTLGTRTAGTATGKVYIIYGSKSNTASVDLATTALLPASTGVTYTGIASTGFGVAVSGAGGDISADTVSDFLIGAPLGTKSTLSNTGIVYEFRGQKIDTASPGSGSGYRLHASLLVLASFFVALMF